MPTDNVIVLYVNLFRFSWSRQCSTFRNLDLPNPRRCGGHGGVGWGGRYGR